MKAMVLVDRDGKEIHEGDIIQHSIDGRKQSRPYIVTTVEELVENAYSADSYYRWDDAGKIIGNSLKKIEVNE